MMRYRWVAVVVAATVALLATLGAPLAAGAQDPQLSLRRLDSEDPAQTQATFIWTGEKSAAEQIGVQVNGTSTAVTSLENPTLGDLEGSIAVVVDTGTQMNENGRFQAAKEALRPQLTALAESGVVVSIWAAGKTPQLLQPFTSSPEKIEDALDRMGPSEESALWGTLEQAASTVRNQGTSKQGNILVVAADRDTVTQTSAAAARGEVVGSNAVLIGINVQGNLDADALQDVAAASGGFTLSASDAAGTGDAITSALTTFDTQQYVATFDSGVNAGDVAEFTLTVGGVTVEGSSVIGSDAIGHAVVSQEAVTNTSPTAFLQNGFGLLLAVLLVGAAAAGIAYAITLLVTDDNELTAVLSPYADGFTADTDEDDEASLMAKSAILQRAVDLTTQVAESQGYLARMEASLERANLPLRGGEAIFFYIAFVIVVTFGAFFFFRNALGGLVVGIIAAMIPAAVLSSMAATRKKKFLSQLPDTLQLLSGTLRAGYSLMQGVEAVSQEVEDPMGLELRRVVTEARLGRPLEESLDGMADRMDSPDFAWAVMAIRIQREVGGNLSELLLTVAETMTARERLRREVAALTAEGRVSAYVLAGLPVALGLVMYTINPKYTGTLFSETLGIVLLVLAAVGMLVGFLWMRKIINIEI